MKIIVVGAGVVGVSTAWELLSRGHTVELFERDDMAGNETSFANGGMLTAGMCEPWNAPGVWKDLIASFFDAKSPMKLHLDAVPGLALWGLRFLAQSSAARFRANTEASYRLCAYSVEITDRWVNELGLDCDYRPATATAPAQPRGDLKIFASADAAAFSRQLADMLQPLGLQAQFLTREQALEKEPALLPIRDRIGCGLYYPGDPAGDAHLFSRALAERLQAAGGVMHLGSEVSAIQRRGSRVTGVTADGQRHDADAVVVCAARDTPALTGAVGVRLPIKPVKGYSLTLDASHIDPQRLPKIAVINQAMHAAVNPLGSRLRVAGTAEFTRRPIPVLSPARVENLMDLLAATYPEVAADMRLEDGTPWCGFRPMSYDGCPFIGASGVAGLWINSGHGYLGWTQAAGSAKLLADQLQGNTTAIAAAPYRVQR